MQSLWEKEVSLPVFPKAEGEKWTDVLIIGGGFTGILCAYFLKKAGLDSCLLEAGRIAQGVSGHTTAKITVQHGLIYHEIAKRYGTEAAKQYYEANRKALEQYRMLCGEINCDFEEKDNYVYSQNNRRKLEQEAKVLEQIGAEVFFEETLPLPVSLCGAVGIRKQAQFHPLKFLAEITKGLKLYENTRVLGFGSVGDNDGCFRTVRTEHGSIHAKNVIVATHFPMLNKHGSYFMKLYQHRSYVVALENAPKLPGMYVDEDKKGTSFRNAGEYLLLGGGGHRTGKEGGGYTQVCRDARMFYPGAREVCRFAAQDCMSLDGIPYIGPYSKRTGGIFVATGFNKWGMTSSMVSAMMLSEAVQGKKSEYEEVFSPSRSMLTGQLAVNIAESVSGLLSFSGKRCPHLGCALKWNKEEHSWDCPCHGSRFSEEGKVLNNPANGGLE